LYFRKRFPSIEHSPGHYRVLASCHGSVTKNKTSSQRNAITDGLTRQWSSMLIHYCYIYHIIILMSLH